MLIATLYFVTAAGLLALAARFGRDFSRAAALALQVAAYSPFTWIACIAPAVQSFTFTGSIAFFIAGLGMFLFARELGASERASIVAAIAFMFSSPIAFQILWPVGFAWTLLP